MGKYTLVVTDTGNDIGTLTGQTLSLGVLSGSGPKGDGWTGVTFDNSTNVFTFTSNDGLGYVSDPVNADIVLDTTPQLGGDLELNNNDITGTGNINITGTITASSTITSNDLVVNGDLTVSGTTTTVNTETINLADNIILVNSNYTGSTPTENGGIEVERGTLTNKSFVWDETNDKWTVGSETFVAGTLEVGTITVTGTVDGRDVATDGSKLDGIEAGADVTDTANVTAAGALMATGGTMTGNLSFGDNDKAIFGAGSDLQIYHDGSNSYISDTGTGDLRISGSTNVDIRDVGGYKTFRGVSRGEAILYHDNNQKLATTSTGIDVTGTVTADGLTSVLLGDTQGKFSGWSVVGANTASGAIELGQTPAYQGVISYAADGSTRFIFDNTYGSTASTFEFRSNTSATPKTHMKITGGGDIHFYEDTGTTAKFFWDASTERLGLGTVTPSAALDVVGAINVTDAATTRTNLDVDQAGTALALAIALG